MGTNVDFNAADYKVLIVDDVMSNVLLLKVLLKNMHYQIATANDGLQALKAVETEHPDLILLDVMMPGLNGFEVAQRLQESPETKEIPIIFLTALNATSDIVRGFQAGANDFISKPFNKEELLIRISHQISLIAARRVITQQTEELRRIMSGRDKLYSVIAHDLRSPMASIKMILDMVLLSIPPEQIGQEIYDMLNTADRTTEETFLLLDNLLKWTKSQIGRLNVAYQHFDIVPTLDGVAQIISMLAKTKNITFTTECPEALEVYADSDMVKTVVRNLSSNAVKFTPEGGAVRCCVEQQGDMAVVSVIDNGCGMSPESQSKLLNPQTHFSTFGTGNEEGSGLGLLLCQDFVEKNGGKLWFESELGKGSTFHFSVPLHAPDPVESKETTPTSLS
ncbi:MAG: hybrid sensor histidine kinase/response regulator [Alistipes sp.]|nr:hybrid sensor histidine kinase/response regulator [Alistipes sp.]